jgi:filamentous hemagglutinin family protein
MIGPGRDKMTRVASLLLAFLASLYITTAPVVSFAQSNLLVGTWKLNLEKSKYTPGPAPKSLTRTTEAVGQNYRTIFEGVTGQGAPVKVVFGPYTYDGKPYPVTGTADYDAASYKQVSNSMSEVTLTKAGKNVQITTGILSADGKIYTITNSGITANGQQFTNISVYDKQ